MKKTFVALLLFLLFVAFYALTAIPSFAESTDAFTVSYDKKLNAATGKSPDEARTLLDELLSCDGTIPDAAVSGYMNFLGKILSSLSDNYWDDEEYAESLRNNDPISPRYGEGGIGYGANYGAIHTALGGRLSEAYDRYFEIMETYLTGYLVDDMALMISWDDLAQYLVDLSVFRICYPRFIEIDSLDDDLRFGFYLYAGCFNLDNTPVVDYDNTLSPDVKASYEKFLNDPASGDVLFYKNIEMLYQVWKDNNFVYTLDVQNYIAELEAKLYGAE